MLWRVGGIRVTRSAQISITKVRAPILLALPGGGDFQFPERTLHNT